MRPRELYYFLGRCLALGEAPQLKEEVLLTINKPSFSWEQFVQMGSSHLVLPALYVKLKGADLLSYLPKELVAHLEEIHSMNLDRNNKFLQQVQWLVELLKKEEIQPVLLKGAGALLDELYEDPAERVISDIDCLVSEEDFYRAVELVKAEGYENPPFHPASLPMKHHYPSLFKPGEPAKIEIHRYPVGRQQLKYLDMDAFNSQLFKSENPHPSSILTGHDQILINVLHSQLKDKGQYYANIPLRNIYEFYRLSLKHDLSALKFHHPHLKKVLNNYMTVGDKLFSPGFQFPLEKRLGTRLFMIRFELNKSIRLYARWSKTTRSVADLIHAYLLIIFRALFHKELRRYLRVRLSNPSWYKHHLRVIRKRFSK